MRESTFLREARMEARQEDLLRALQLRFPGLVSEHLERRIREQTDLGVLRQWFDLAVTAPTLEAFETNLGR